MADVSHAAFLRESIAPLVDLVFPPRCPLCGDGIGEQTGLCPACWATLVIPAGTVCQTCQRPLPESRAGSVLQCAPCLQSPPVHAGIAAGTLYNEPSRKLVLAFKHGGRIALAPLMAGLISARLPPVPHDAVIVPVPLHRWRLWRRGYNQAALLAQALGKLAGRSVVLDALVRTRQTPVLGGLGKSDRRKALAGAIAVQESRKGQLSARPVILVDDVLTSGATTDACVRVLKKAGAASVTIACFARVLEDEAIAVSQAQNETPGV